MRANCWTGTNSVEVLDVPDPKILNPRDAIVKITSTAICGSDLHLYDEHIERGDIDPTFIITHRLGLENAPGAYETFKHKEDDCVKVVLKPGSS